MFKKHATKHWKLFHFETVAPSISQRNELHNDSKMILQKFYYKEKVCYVFKITVMLCREYYNQDPNDII